MDAVSPFGKTVIAPNPGNGRFVVRVADPTELDLIRVTDAAGRLVAERQPSGGQTEFDDRLAPGTYTVTLLARGGERAGMQVVVE